MASVSSQNSKKNISSQPRQSERLNTSTLKKKKTKKRADIRDTSMSSRKSIIKNKSFVEKQSDSKGSNSGNQ